MEVVVAWDDPRMTESTGSIETDTQERSTIDSEPARDERNSVVLRSGLVNHGPSSMEVPFSNIFQGLP